jgi:hypothetical protein
MAHRSLFWVAEVSRLSRIMTYVDNYARLLAFESITREVTKDVLRFANKPASFITRDTVHLRVLSGSINRLGRDLDTRNLLEERREGDTE